MIKIEYDVIVQNVENINHFTGVQSGFSVDFCTAVALVVTGVTLIYALWACNLGP